MEDLIIKSLYQHDKAEISFNQETNSIELIWKKSQDDSSYKLIFEKVLQFLTEFKATGFLSDIRKEGVVGPASSKWVQEEVMPKAFSYGLKKISVVMDADIFKEFYIKNVSKAAGNDRMKYFDSLEAAREWLLD